MFVLSLSRNSTALHSAAECVVVFVVMCFVIPARWVIVLRIVCMSICAFGMLYFTFRSLSLSAVYVCCIVPACARARARARARVLVFVRSCSYAIHSVYTALCPLHFSVCFHLLFTAFHAI